MTRLTVDQVIDLAKLDPKKNYLHTDTGSIATGEEWIETLRCLDPEFDSAFDPDGDGVHLVEVN